MRILLLFSTLRISGRDFFNTSTFVDFHNSFLCPEFSLFQNSNGGCSCQLEILIFFTRTLRLSKLEQPSELRDELIADVRAKLEGKSTWWSWLCINELLALLSYNVRLLNSHPNNHNPRIWGDGSMVRGGGQMDMLDMTRSSYELTRLGQSSLIDHELESESDIFPVPVTPFSVWFDSNHMSQLMTHMSSATMVETIHVDITNQLTSYMVYAVVSPAHKWFDLSKLDNWKIAKEQTQVYVLSKDG